MITAGDNKIFSIEAKLGEINQGWLLGSFRFVLHGRSCGNWSDFADLNGCYSWLKDFSTNSCDRYEPGLLNMSPEQIFERLVVPVLVQDDGRDVPELYKKTYARFHISHLGMSSFNSAIMVLVEEPDHQRCVWQAAKDGPIYSDLFPSKHMQGVAEEFCRLFEAEALVSGYLHLLNRTKRGDLPP